jgi:quercetin dioxygenase-like cupin family protein
MFVKHGLDGYAPALPGITRKTLAYGARTLMTEFVLRRGSALPEHAHPHEQIGYLVQGRLRLKIAGEECDVGPGDSWCIPPGAPHGADVIEDAVAVEVFAPVRADYLPKGGPA